MYQVSRVTQNIVLYVKAELDELFPKKSISVSRIGKMGCILKVKIGGFENNYMANTLGMRDKKRLIECIKDDHFMDHSPEGSEA